MKKLKQFAIGLIAVIAFTVTASAQLGTPPKLIASGSREAYAAITNNTSCSFTNAIIDATKGKDVYVWFSSELSGAGTTANTVTVQGSADKTTWVAYGAFTVTPAGTTRVVAGTNMAIGALPYVRVSAIANANGNTGFITNYSVTYLVK